MKVDEGEDENEDTSEDETGGEVEARATVALK